MEGKARQGKVPSGDSVGGGAIQEQTRRDADKETYWDG